ncbi:MAG: HAD family hydrolase [Pseudomonadota bacterium]
MIVGSERVRGVLFDKDGTLLDFHKTWGKLGEQVILTLSAGEPRLARRLAEVAGFDMTTMSYAPGSPIVAGAIDEIVAGWLPLLDQWERAELEEWLNIQATSVRGDALQAASRDIKGLMRRLRSAGLVLGVATHDGEAPAKLHLTDLDVIESFDFIAGYDSGYGSKPGPGMLQGFSAKTGVRAETTIVVGDSLHDLGMAKSGGALAGIGVLTGPARRSDLEAHADLVIASIDDLPTVLGI